MSFRRIQASHFLDCPSRTDFFPGTFGRNTTGIDMEPLPGFPSNSQFFASPARAAIQFSLTLTNQSEHKSHKLRAQSHKIAPVQMPATNVLQGTQNYAQLTKIH